MTTAPQNAPNRPEPLLAYGHNPPKRFPFKRLLPFAIVAVAIVIMIPFVGRAMEPTVGRHVSRRFAPIAGLPPSASDVCYSLRGAFGAGEAYEFTIDESAFLAWAKGQGWKVEPITSSVTVECYGDYSNNPADPRNAQIDSGYRYYWVDPDASDNTLTVAYDSVRGRAYWSRSYR